MSGRTTAGTFTTGNPGRPKGARNKATQAVLALLEGEGEALTRKAIQMALAGDGVALRLSLPNTHLSLIRVECLKRGFKLILSPVGTSPFKLKLSTRPSKKRR